MSSRLRILIILILIISAPSARADIWDSVYETALPNGLKVLMLENHKAPLVTFQVWYRVGSRNEQWRKTGISHVLEHMMFKGTPKVSGSEFSRIIQENGGNYNAFTSRDATAYYATIGSANLSVVMELEADRMRNLVLRQEDFETERMVVVEERRMRTEDDPRSSLYELVNAEAFQLQPYHWPVIGWMQDLKGLAIDDVKAYYNDYYTPTNAFLVVVGDFKREELLKRINRTFAPLPKGPGRSGGFNQDPPQQGERLVLLNREAQLPFYMAGYKAPNLRHEDAYVLEVIASILSEGKSSRLYRQIVLGKRLALSIAADHELLSRDPSLFFISAEAPPGVAVADLEKAVNDEIESLGRDLVSGQELEKAKNQLEADFIFGQDSLFYQANLIARHEIALDWKAARNYLPSIRKVTPEDIRRVAAQYLVPARRTVGILNPLPKPAASSGTKAPQQEKKADQ